jgi:hypothetical protein
MPDADYEDDQFLVPDRIDDPVLARANPVEIVLTLELDRAARPRIDGQLVDPPGDAPPDALRQVSELLDRRGSELDAVLGGW